MNDWPFDQAPKVAAIVDAAVVERAAPVLVVVHYSDDHGWAFLSGGPVSVEQGRVICMESALRLDPSLRSIADLPPGWSASRAHVNDSLGARGERRGMTPSCATASC